MLNMDNIFKKKFLVTICLSATLLLSFVPTTYSGFASPENRTFKPQGMKGMTTNTTSIVLVHGAWSDGSVWSKVIPILKDAGHKVIAAQLPLQSLGEDVAAVKRAVEQLGNPTILVGHSYGGEVITNAGYNNPNVTGLVYIAALAPDENKTSIDLFEMLPQPDNFLQAFSNNIIVDSAGFSYFNPDKFREFFAQDVHPSEADILAVVQKPTNELITIEKSGPPAWKQLPAWYQISENDLLIPPDIQRLYAERMNATTVSLNSSHMSLISQPYEIAELILNATKGAS
jgi:pimeloyl-ACP methyl ester carboxylesterase